MLHPRLYFMLPQKDFLNQGPPPVNLLYSVALLSASSSSYPLLPPTDPLKPPTGSALTASHLSATTAFFLFPPHLKGKGKKASKMMQISNDSACNKHSLINVMHRFIAAANNMDETIMVPSLLRDLPLEEQAAGEVEPNNNNNDDHDEPPCPNKQRDMYEHYLLLKSIRNDMEWGLLKKEMNSGASFLEMAVKQQQQEEEKEHKQQQQAVTGEVPLEDNSDLEHQFHYHLRGLFGVLSKLTLQADNLTNRYKREIGGGNFLR